MKLKEKDEIVSISILNGHEFMTEDREKYLKIPDELRMKIAKDFTAISEVDPD